MLRLAQRNVLKINKKISLFLVIMLVCSGCIVRIADDGSRHDSSSPYDGYSYNMWFNDADVYCEYDAVDSWSRWTMTASPDTSYGDGEIADVYVDIVGSYSYTYVNSWRLTPQGNGRWAVSFDNYGGHGTSYYCGSSYDFQFTAYDYEGYYTTTWYYW